MTSFPTESMIREWLSTSAESEWLEFKHNNADPDMIGCCASALSNSAALHGQPFGYVIWGIDDDSHRIVGTTFNPSHCKKNNTNLNILLAANLSPPIPCDFFSVRVDDLPVVVMRVESAHHTPVRYLDREYIRVGENTTLLRNQPERERRLWSSFDRQPYESRAATPAMSSTDAIELIDFPKYFEQISRRLPVNHPEILDHLDMDGIVRREGSGAVVTYLGALLFARSLRRFDRLSRKAVRVVVYDGEDRSIIKRRYDGDRGYAVGFESLIDIVSAHLPENVHIGHALRTETAMFPPQALRELVANCLIHQDLSVSGAGPCIEVFNSRIEITNPGDPLIRPDRFLDLPPRSRNERLADIMRRCGFCEELGSGVDRVLKLVEAFQLPAPRFETVESGTRVVLFGPRPFPEMDRDDRIRACYQHASLLYITGSRMTNTTLRQRLGVPATNQSQISRLIGEALDLGIVRRDPPTDTSRRHAKYVPYWA